VHIVLTNSLDSEEFNIHEYNTGKNKSLSSPSQENHKDKKKRSSKFNLWKINISYTYIIFVSYIHYISASPFEKRVRRRWIKEEKSIAYASFKHYIDFRI
jgi:hypothetical protein